MKLLVVGLRGTGIEIAKNCLLQGVSSLALYDPKAVAVADTGANFFLAAEDVGRPRDGVCRPRLQELNPDASVTVADTLDEALVGSMTCVVFTRAGKGCENPNFKGSYLGRFPLVLADFWTSDHPSERSRP